MILRRFTEHVRDQNWFAVGLDVLVVIVGIFLGLQVTDWNEEREERRAEQRYLERLENDMDIQLQKMEMRSAYFQNASEDNNLVVQWLAGNAPADIEPARMISAFYLSTVIYHFVPFSNTWEELQTTGKVDILRDDELRDHIAKYFHETSMMLTVWNIEDNNPYRNAVRSIIPAEMQKAIVEKCELSVGNELVLLPDCVAEVDQVQAAVILDELKAIESLEKMARRNHSRILVALRLYDVNGKVAREVLGTIDKAQH